MGAPGRGAALIASARYNGAVSDSFRERLAEAVETNDSLLCVGLDPDPALMPFETEDVVEFNKAIIEALEEELAEA